MKKFISALVCILALGLSSARAFAVNNEHSSSTATRQFLLKKNVTLPSNKIESRVIRVQFPKGYKTPLHTHEGQGPRYVVKGKLRIVDGDNNQEFSAGEVFWETGTEMTVENIGGGEAEIIIFEIVPAAK